MKKHLLSLATLLFSLVSVPSFGQSVQKLDSRLIEGWEEAYFHYNNNGLIDSTYIYLNDYKEFESYRKYTYNENGLCVREDDYQMLNYEFRHVSYIEYFYNEKNQLVKRLNYNSFGSDTFEAGGEIIWSYNEDGTVATVETSMPGWDDPEQWDLYSREIRKYNDKKLLIEKETWTVPFFGTADDLYISSASEHSYNDKDQLVMDINKFYYEDSGDEPATTAKCTYEYDEYGNLTVYNSYLNTDNENPQMKYIYHYDLNTPKDQVIYPFNLEDNNMAIHLIAAAVSANRIEYDEWWQVPNESETGELEHIGDYEWNYSEFAYTGINNTNVDVNRVGYFIYNNEIHFTNLKKGTSIQIFDMNGAKVAQKNYDGNAISLTGLAKGGYICKVANQRVPFKFVR